MAKKGKIVVNRDLCKGCGLCIRACPVKILKIDAKSNSTGSYPCAVTDAEKCIACGNCYDVCPDICIDVYELEKV